MRHRGGAPPPEDDDSSSSSSDDDAFAALSSNSKGTKKKGAVVAKKKEMAHQVTPIESSTFIPTATSTATATATETKNALTKLRHHGTSDARKAKLDALLQELQETKQQDPASYYGPGGGGCRGTSSGSDSGGGAHTHSRPLEKMGSYVEPGEEHLTTNVFVGNLHPSVTEEELTDLFRQFGETLLNIHNSIPSAYLCYLLDFR
jgi:U2-associated protein SR140